ncbi:hypothetical protein ACH5RR_032585 [Cinchona calisaya]|uniref:Uncharacterized protein n=1 Tax=Cinchona calisaya TaxID=153742 RepID=A0ABD2YJL9_9GENT
MKFLEVHHIGLKNRWHLATVSKRNVIKSVAEEAVLEEGDVLEKKKRRTFKRTTTRTTNIGSIENPENVYVSVINGNLSDEENTATSNPVRIPIKPEGILRRQEQIFCLLTMNH